LPKLKLPLQKSLGKRFESTEAVKKKNSKELEAIPSSAYERCSEEKRWHMCVANNGNLKGTKLIYPIKTIYVFYLTIDF